MNRKQKLLIKIALQFLPTFILALPFVLVRGALVLLSLVALYSEAALGKLHVYLFQSTGKELRAKVKELRNIKNQLPD